LVSHILSQEVLWSLIICRTTAKNVSECRYIYRHYGIFIAIRYAQWHSEINCVDVAYIYMWIIQIQLLIILKSSIVKFHKEKHNLKDVF
jgi:hypothetical protein